MGKKHTIAAAEVSLAVKTLNAAGCDEIRPEMLKGLNHEGVLWLTRVRQVAWSSAKVPKDWQTGAIIPLHRRGTGVNAPTHNGTSCYDSALSKVQLEIHSCVSFVVQNMLVVVSRKVNCEKLWSFLN